jgi:hypothetical protein
MDTEVGTGSLFHAADEREVDSGVVQVAKRTILGNHRRNERIRPRTKVAIAWGSGNPALTNRAAAATWIDGDGGGTSYVQHRDHPVGHCVRCRISKIEADGDTQRRPTRDEPRASARADEGRQIAADEAASPKTSGAAGRAVAAVAPRHSTMMDLMVRWQVPQPSPAPQASVTCWRVRAPASMLERTFLSETPWHKQTTMESAMSEMKVNFKRDSRGQ